MGLNSLNHIDMTGYGGAAAPQPTKALLGFLGNNGKADRGIIIERVNHDNPAASMTYLLTPQDIMKPNATDEELRTFATQFADVQNLNEGVRGNNITVSGSFYKDEK